MSDREALLAAIKAFPENDAPRLIYADWLDEHGESERAEFIRVQVELWRLPGCGHPTAWGRSDCRHCELRRIEQTHLGSKYCIPWRALGFGQAPRGALVRGFVEQVTCTAADWLTHSAAILAEHPVRKVRLTTDMTVRAIRHSQLRGADTAIVVFDLEAGGLSVRFTKPTAPRNESGGITFDPFALAWPGIALEAAPVHVEEVPPDVTTFAEFVNQTFNDAVQCLAVPPHLLTE